MGFSSFGQAPTLELLRAKRKTVDTVIHPKQVIKIPGK